jgi:hypothetical protein
MKRPFSTKGSVGLAVFVAIAVSVFAVPAGAGVTGGCTGEAVIDGVAYGPDNDTPSNAIVIPDRDDAVASWSGEVPYANTNFSGDAGIRVGPVILTVAEWAGTNADDVRAADGEYSLGELRAALPVDVGIAGIYEVIVNHEADGGSCRADVFVEFEGNPLTTPLGIVTVVGLGLTLIGLVSGMFAKTKETS